MSAPISGYKIRVWAILGEWDTGKSTVIGHLISQLGMGGARFRLIPLRGGGFLRVHPRRQSLQEAKRSPNRVVKDAEKQARELQKKYAISIGWLNILVAIRTDTINRLPPADRYLSHFVDVGWQIESLVLLAEKYEDGVYLRYSAFGAPICEIYDSQYLAQNESKHSWLVGQCEIISAGLKLLSRRHPSTAWQNIPFGLSVGKTQDDETNAIWAQQFQK